MFRHERPQAGRQRQFHQLVEWLGVEQARSDVEVIALAWDLLANLGVGGLELELNSLGTAEDRQDYREALVAWLDGALRPSTQIPRRVVLIRCASWLKTNPGITGRRTYPCRCTV